MFQHFSKPQTAKECADQADRAIKAGRLDEADALLARAKAIKAGRLEAFERQAEVGMMLPQVLSGIRETKQADARLGVALERAYKSAVLDDLGPEVKRLADELHDGSYSQTAFDKAQAYTKYLKGGDPARIGAIVGRAVLSPRQLMEAVKMGMSVAELKATMVESQSTQGGFLVAETTREEILGRATSLTVVRSRATIDTTTDASIAFPVWQGSGDIYSTALRGVWGSETQAGSAENPTLGKAGVEIKLWRLKIAISKSLLEDAGPRFVPNLNKRIAELSAVAEDAEELVGAGVLGPLGILAQQVAGTLANKDVRVTNSGNATDLTSDGVINMIYSLPMQYRSAPGFCVTCASATVKRLRLLKDGSGRYLFDDRDHTLCGYPLVESESMPAIAANAFPLLAGDFSGYYIADRLGLAIQLYMDSNTADQDMGILYVRRRVGGVPGEGYRFAALKCST